MERDILKYNMMNMTWPQVEEMAKKNALVLLPLGVIEEHGRHLPLGTDIYMSLAQAEDICENIKKLGLPALVAPPFYWGIVSVITKCFPGTFTASEETMVANLHEILQGLCDAGFKRVIGVNSHGDKKHRQAVLKAFAEFNRDHELKAKWLAFEDELEDDGLKGNEDYVLTISAFPFEDVVWEMKTPIDTFDVHAGAYETAFMRDIFPDVVDMDTALSLKPTMLDESKREKWNTTDSANKEVVPDGHAGDPAFSQHLFTDMTKLNQHIAKGILEAYSQGIKSKE